MSERSGLIMYFPTLSASFLVFALTLAAIAGAMIQKTGQDVGKTGTDSFPLEESYTHSQLIQKDVNLIAVFCLFFLEKRCERRLLFHPLLGEKEMKDA